MLALAGWVVAAPGWPKVVLLVVAALVSHVSRWMTLEPGDLLFTGTPAGVGPLRPGDRVSARIEKVGELSFEVEGEGDA